MPEVSRTHFIFKMRDTVTTQVSVMIKAFTLLLLRQWPDIVLSASSSDAIHSELKQKKNIKSLRSTAAYPNSHNVFVL
jgi:hypothetical protein